MNWRIWVWSATWRGHRGSGRVRVIVATDKTRALRDQPPPALVHLYTAHRALLRARLAVAHLLDPHPRTPETWLPLAERYLQRALAATEAFTSSMRHGRP